MTNTERALAARAALATYTCRVYGNRLPEILGAPTVEGGLDGQTAKPDTDIQTAVGDLICDLGHYCRAVGLDYPTQLVEAQRHYSAECGLGWDEEES